MGASPPPSPNSHLPELPQRGTPPDPRHGKICLISFVKLLCCPAPSQEEKRCNIQNQHYQLSPSKRTAHHATAASVYNYGPTAAYNWSRLTAAAAGHHAAHLKSEWPTSADYMAASLQQHSDLSHHYAAAHYNMTGKRSREPCKIGSHALEGIVMH